MMEMEEAPRMPTPDPDADEVYDADESTDGVDVTLVGGPRPESEVQDDGADQ